MDGIEDQTADEVGSAEKSAQWQPRKAPPVEFGDPERHRHLTNFVAGRVGAFVLLGMGWSFYGPWSLRWADPLSKTEALTYGLGFCIASLLSEIVLASSWVLIGNSYAEAVIRNPMSMHKIPFSNIREISYESGFCPVLMTRDGEVVRLFALQQSTLDKMRGGSEDLERLQQHVQALIEKAPDGASTSAEAFRRTQVFSWPRLGLLLGWLAWGVWMTAA